MMIANEGANLGQVGAHFAFGNLLVFEHIMPQAANHCQRVGGIQDIGQAPRNIHQMIEIRQGDDPVLVYLSMMALGGQQERIANQWLGGKLLQQIECVFRDGAQLRVLGNLQQRVGPGRAGSSIRLDQVGEQRGFEHS